MKIFRAAVTAPDFREDLETARHQGHEHGEGDEQSFQTSTAVHPKAIRPVGTLHLTLGVMSLNKEQLEEAVTLLRSVSLASLLESDQGEPLSSDGAESSGGEVTATVAPGTTTTITTTTRITVPSASSASAETTGSALPVIETITETSTSVNPETSTSADHDLSPLTIDLKGLVSMHPPQRTSILYCAPTDPTNRLERVGLAAQALFRQHGFLVADDRPLKLHATIVNTIYAKGRNHHGRRGPPTPSSRTLASRPTTAAAASTTTNPFAGDDGGKPDEDTNNNNNNISDRTFGHGPNAHAPLRLDARALLERFQDFVWAEGVQLDRLAICEMGARKVVDAAGKEVGDEKYTEVASVRLGPPEGSFS